MMSDFNDEELEVEDLIDGEEQESAGPIDEYDIISSPTDFNMSSLVSFIDRGALSIPWFQRNYVWERKMASKLIESILLNLPIPQLYFYEHKSNEKINWKIIDGQQRLLSIYFFMKGKFPTSKGREALATLKKDNTNSSVLDNFFNDKENFTDFKLVLDEGSKYNNKMHDEIDNVANIFDFGRTLRTFVIKQITPSKDDSSMYEIFQRLNTGGVKLTPQEIRMSLNDSNFYTYFHDMNSNKDWRSKILHQNKAHKNFKDIENILRLFAF